MSLYDFMKDISAALTRIEDMKERQNQYESKVDELAERVAALGKEHELTVLKSEIAAGKAAEEATRKTLGNSVSSLKNPESEGGAAP